jgi:hypothetical protein
MILRKEFGKHFDQGLRRNRDPSSTLLRKALPFTIATTTISPGPLPIIGLLLHSRISVQLDNLGPAIKSRCTFYYVYGARSLSHASTALVCDSKVCRWLEHRRPFYVRFETRLAPHRLRVLNGIYLKTKLNAAVETVLVCRERKSDDRAKHSDPFDAMESTASPR